MLGEGLRAKRERRVWGAANRCMELGRSVEERERGDRKGRATVSLKTIAWLREWGGSWEGRQWGRGRGREGGFNG
jgi:hypothetical protein